MLGERADEMNAADVDVHALGPVRRRPREMGFRVSAAGALVAALFHAAAMLSQPVAALEYKPTYPTWRHVAFIVIDMSLAWLLLRRPRWLVWAFAALTLQILSSHGVGAWAMWTAQHRIDWISVAISIAAPVVLLLLFMDRRDRRMESVL